MIIMGDPSIVMHPDHYQSKKGIEAIEVIEAFTDELKGIEAIDTGNVIKYILRWKKKNGVEDLKKARWYLNHLIDRIESKEDDGEQLEFDTSVPVDHKYEDVMKFFV